jgi:hypothetical protein
VLHLELQARRLNASISGSGDIVARGTADETELKMSSSGRFEGSSFTTGTAKVSQTGAGDAILAVENDLTVRLTGSGDFIIAGGSPDIDSTIRGSGRVVNQEE